MAINAVAKRRVLKLIEFMEKLPRSANKHFDMDTWCSHDGEGHEHLKPGDVVAQSDVMACGTTACAAGWAATMPYFRRLGLELRWDGFDAAMYVNGRPDVMFSKIPGLFKLSHDQADDLFSAMNSDRTPKQWARRARKLLKEWSAA